MLHTDFFVFVDADVDPLDTRAVLEAIALHADPDDDFHQFGTETMPKVPLNIYQTPDEKGDVQTGTSKAKTAKAYVDATRDDTTTEDGGRTEGETGVPPGTTRTGAATAASTRSRRASTPTPAARRRAQEVLAAAGMPRSELGLLDRHAGAGDGET
jgi:4-hydroxy-3-polyprenylbenzoate decarboxylase